MPRFFSAAAPVEGSIILSGEDARHIAKSLRMREGEDLTVCDGAGTDHLCTLGAVSAESVTARVLKSLPSKGEPSVEVTLFMSLPKADKMELIVQKATELGVFAIVPVLAHRCVSRPDEKSLARKIERYQKIAEEAAKQSGRGRIPRVSALCGFTEAVNAAARADAPLFLYEAEQEQGLRRALEAGSHKTVSIFVGPEGGFEEAEAQQAQAGGLISVSLGPRILRCETAPLAALAAIQYHTGNL